MMIPFFQQFREMGVKDKAAGVSAETAQQRIKRIPLRKISSVSQKHNHLCGRKIHGQLYAITGKNEAAG